MTTWYETDCILATEQRHTSGVYPKRPVAIVRGAEATVWDADGRAYLDCTAGQGVANIGHSHPTVAAAIARQARSLITCPEIFFNDQRAALLHRLSERLPGGMTRLFLCNSGAEAVEGALKIARLHTGRPGIVATMRGFHGRTMGALAATWERRYREPFAPLVPGVRHVPFDDLAAMEEAIGPETAAVLVEIVQGEGGVRPGAPAYFQGLRRLCDERGALLIVDEVQTGFGRTGRWFACEHAAIVPDLMCLGKAIAGGVPMGAVAIATSLGELPTGAHGSTFGGNPLACAAALATLDVYEAEGLVERAARLGDELMTRLNGLDSPVVREVRGLGLMVGVDLRVRVTPVLQGLLAHGVLALPAGSTVLRLLPPLVITRQELDRVVEALDAVLAEQAVGR